VLLRAAVAVVEQIISLAAVAVAQAEVDHLALMAPVDQQILAQEAEAEA
jgi:hypothetical protein